MKIKLVGYAVLGELLPSNPMEYETADDTTAAELTANLAKDFPDAAEILKITRLASEDDYIDRRSKLVDGQEYCLIPPISGG